MKDKKTKSIKANPRRRYDAEFRKNALQMVEDGRSVQDVSESLGIKSSLLYTWRSKVKKATLGNTPDLVEAQAYKDLEKRLRQTEQERDILKKALSIFSRQY